MLDGLSYKELQDLSKQYVKLDKGSGKNGRVLKTDLINHLLPYIRSEMDILSYLKQNDIIFMDGLDYVDLINLRKVNKRMTSYIDHNRLKMILMNKNIIYNGNIINILDYVYQSIRNALYKQHEHLNDRWIDKEVYINALEKQLIKYYIHGIVYRLNKRRIKKLTILPKSMNIKLKGTISFNQIYVKIDMHLKVNKKVIDYIASINHLFLNWDSMKIQTALYHLFFYTI